MEILGSEQHKIIHEDALEALKTLPDNSMDLLFADPPYNIGKNSPAIVRFYLVILIQGEPPARFYAPK